MPNAPARIPSRTATLPIEDLKPHPRNPNVGDVESIRESIRVNGVYRDLLVQESTNHVLAGNHTLEALRLEGATEATVKLLSVDDATALRILLVDNRATRLGRDDLSDLHDLLADMAEAEGDLAGTGFTEEDVMRLINELQGVQEGGATHEQGMPDVMVTVGTPTVAGPYRFAVPGAAFSRWSESMKNEFGWASEDVIEGIKTRLGLADFLGEAIE